MTYNDGKLANCRYKGENAIIAFPVTWPGTLQTIWITTVLRKRLKRPMPFPRSRLSGIKRLPKNNEPEIDRFAGRPRTAAGCHVALCRPSGLLDEISFNFDDFCHYNEI
jgi:hypothetical protein